MTQSSRLFSAVTTPITGQRSGTSLTAESPSLGINVSKTTELVSHLKQTKRGNKVSTPVVIWGEKVDVVNRYKYLMTGWPEVHVVWPALTHLKGVWRVVHTVHPQAVDHAAALQAPKHRQLQPLEGRRREGLAHQRVRARLVQQEVAARGGHQAVTGSGLISDWHHILPDTTQSCSQSPTYISASAWEPVVPVLTYLLTNRHTFFFGWISLN